MPGSQHMRYNDDGSDVWIGAGVCILRGVTIGDGVVIGAGAVVKHDIAPYDVVAGVPAEVCD